MLRKKGAEDKNARYWSGRFGPHPHPHPLPQKKKQKPKHPSLSITKTYCKFACAALTEISIRLRGGYKHPQQPNTYPLASIVF